MAHCRLTVSITPELDTQIRNLSLKSGISTSALTRAALERLVADPSIVFKSGDEADSAAPQIATRRSQKSQTKSSDSRQKRDAA